MATGRFRVGYPRISGFASSGSGMISHPRFLGFGTPKLIGFGFRFGFSPADIQWIIFWSKILYFIVYLVIILFI